MAKCEGCPLGPGPQVFGEGHGSIAIIGEAPGFHEARQGRPFVGPAGKELDGYLSLAGLARSDVFITNLVACRPPGNRVPKPAERASCRPRLMDELVGRSTLVLLGDTAVREFLPTIALKSYHGIPIPRQGITYVPMYHPAAGLHQPNLRGVMSEDWRTLVTRLTSVWKVPIKPMYSIGANIVEGDLVALDTETDGEKFLVMSSSPWEGVAYMHHEPKMGNCGLLLFHNAKFDLKVLATQGIDLLSHHMADTMIAAYLCGEPQLGLKPLALKRLGVEMSRLGELMEEAQDILLHGYLEEAKKVELPKSMAKSLNDVLASVSPAKALARRHKLRELLGQPPEATVGDVARLLPEKFFQYSCADADMTRRLWPGFEAEMERKGVTRLFWDVEMPLVSVLAKMEMRGLAIDRVRAVEVRDEFTTKAGELKAKLHAEAGLVNPDSRDDVASVLYEVLGLPILGYTDTGKPTTARWALESLAESEPLVQDILTYRHYTKLVSTYLTPWLTTTGRVHPDFNQVRQVSDEEAWGATATGRLSSSGPNFQNVPARTPEGRMVRSCVVAERGRLVSIDDKQIELVLMAIDAEDEGMLAAFYRGDDIHAETARLLFGVDAPTADQRFVGKQVNFMWGYGIRANQFAKSLTVHGIPTTKQEAQVLLHTFEAKRPHLKQRWHEVVAQAKELGHAETFWGRRRYLPTLSIARTEEEFYEAAKQAYSHRIQGTAADISKVALIVVDREAPRDLICVVHDERVLETNLTNGVIRGIIDNALTEIRKIGIPHGELLGMTIKEGTDWGHMTEIP